MSFKIIINDAKTHFDNFASSQKVRYAEKGYTIYREDNVVLKTGRYSDEVKKSYELNGNKPFTLTRSQIVNCVWITK